MGDGIQVMSDTATLVEVDPVTLETRHEYNGQVCNDWNGGDAGCTKLINMTNPAMQVCSGGSAHPWRTDNGDYSDGSREGIGATVFSRLGPAPFPDIPPIPNPRSAQFAPFPVCMAAKQGKRISGGEGGGASQR
eukprot:gene17862-biopygen41632